LDFHVHQDNDEIGTLTNGTYFHAIVDSGTILFNLTAWGTDDNPCQVQIKSGETHYVKVSSAPNPSFFHNAPVLSCQDVADLDALLKMADLKDVDRTDSQGSN
ncbi:MAG TPA: hypothetical protein VLG68_06480, partial [Gammaproteobacteria bacterium]|nr:hypothetical protein [Gammaproteobacteria bacterium]